MTEVATESKMRSHRGTSTSPDCDWCAAMYARDSVPLRARVEVISGYSAHGDRRELKSWIDAVRATSPALQDIYLVHGEVDAQDAFSATLTASGYRVHCPEPGTHVSA